MSDLNAADRPGKAAPTTEDSNAGAASENRPANVKIYERPERMGLSPVLLSVLVVIAIIVAFVLYRTLHH